MDRIIFEGRFLVNLAGGIVRQDDLKAIHSRIDWEHMYRTADYHKIANVVYLGILGNGEKVPERWMERFLGGIRSRCHTAIHRRMLSVRY